MRAVIRFKGLNNPKIELKALTPLCRPPVIILTPGIPTAAFEKSPDKLRPDAVPVVEPDVPRNVPVEPREPVADPDAEPAAVKMEPDAVPPRAVPDAVPVAPPDALPPIEVPPIDPWNDIPGKMLALSTY